MTDGELRTWVRDKINTDAIVWDDQQSIMGEDGMPHTWLFDFRRLFLDAEFLQRITALMWLEIEPFEGCAIGGMESAAVPLVTSLVLHSHAHGKARRGFYVRKSRKPAGLQKRIEGELSDAVILVDDLMNSGRSIERQIDAIEKEGKEVRAVVVIVRFSDPARYERITRRGIELISLFSLHDFQRAKLYPPPPPPPGNPFEVVWKFRGQNPNYYHIVPKSAPALDAERVYFGTDDGTFYALEQNDGSVAWTHKVTYGAQGKYIFSSPAIHDGVVFFGAYDGNVYALHSDDGRQKWVFSEADWVGSSPAVAPDLGLVFIGLEQGLWGRQGAIVGLKIETGEKVWSFEVPAYVHASPAYSSELGIVVCGCNDGMMRAFSAAEGELLWEFQTRGALQASAAFDVERGLVVFGSMDGHLYSLSVTDGSRVHAVPFNAGVYSTPKIGRGRAFIGSLDRTVYAVDLGTGSIAWRCETGGRVFASPEMYEGELYIGSNDGWLYIINPDTGMPANLAHATERIVNKVAINRASGRVFVPTHANELYCVSRK